MKKDWLINRKTDLLLLFTPVWIAWAICFFIPESYLGMDIPLWVWVVLVLGIDVGHVWSTIFRTYLSKREFSNHKVLLLIVPPLAFIAFFLLALLSTTLFWMILAYLAVYHFLKQQYGFMKIFKAKAGDFRKKLISDSFIIYYSMLYPIIYWHLNADRLFNWLIEGDFIRLSLPREYLLWLNTVGLFVYFTLMLYWLWEEIRWNNYEIKRIFTGKVFWILTTAINWYLGIIFFNSDLAFTITNVVAHGVPYYVLIFLYLNRKEQRIYKIKRPFWSKGLFFLAMISIVIFLAFSEEYLWDMLMYRDNPGFFQSLLTYPLSVVKSPFATALVLSLLSLPQVTHYVLDGYIWKSNKSNPHLKEVVLDL